MNFEKVFEKLEELENEIIYLKAQNRLQDVLACKTLEKAENTEKKLEKLNNDVDIMYKNFDNAIFDICNRLKNVEEQDEQLKEHKEWMNSQFNGLCSSAFNNKKTGLNFEQAFKELNKGKKIHRNSNYGNVITKVSGNCIFSINDILAKDWEIVE